MREWAGQMQAKTGALWRRDAGASIQFMPDEIYWGGIAGESNDAVRISSCRACQQH